MLSILLLGTKPKSARKHPAPSNSRPGSASSVSSGKRPPKSARGAKNSPPTKSNNKADSVMSRPPSRGRVGSALQNRPPSRNNTAFHNTARPRTAAEKAADMFGYVKLLCTSVGGSGKSGMLSMMARKTKMMAVFAVS